jgi:hypothetical protein
MGACNNQHFTGVTSSAWSCICSKVESEFGIKITTPSGMKEKDGFTFKWNFVESAKTLDIHCTDSPIIVPCSTIHDAVSKVVHGCLPKSAEVSAETASESAATS